MFLGALMIGTLIVMIALVWFYGGRDRGVDDRARARRSAFALAVLIGGVIVSGGLYLGFKNRPGAYQGSPSFYMDPSQAGQRLSIIGRRAHRPCRVFRRVRTI